MTAPLNSIEVAPTPTFANTLLAKHLAPASKELGRFYFFHQVVVPSGYPYFVWDGRVYHARGAAAFSDTGILEQDLAAPAPELTTA